MEEYVVHVVELPPAGWVDWIQFAISVFTIILAIISLWYTYTSLKNQRKHNYLSVKPYLSIRCERFDKSIEIKVVNVGLGPALISEFKITKDSKKFSSFSDLIKDRNSSWLKEGHIYTIFPHPQTLLRDEVFMLLAYDINVNAQKNDEYVAHKGFNELSKLLQGTTLEILYNDIYNDNKQEFCAQYNI